MKRVEAQFEKIVVAKAKGAGEQTANLAIDSFHLSAGQTGVVKAQDSLGVAEEGFCHGLELTDSAGGGFRDDDFLKLRLYSLHEAKFTFVG